MYAATAQSHVEASGAFGPGSAADFLSGGAGTRYCPPAFLSHLQNLSSGTLLGEPGGADLCYFSFLHLAMNFWSFSLWPVIPNSRLSGCYKISHRNNPDARDISPYSDDQVFGVEGGSLPHLPRVC